MKNEELEEIIRIVKAYDCNTISLETVKKITDGIAEVLERKFSNKTD